jgi:hypothetical protein
MWTMMGLGASIIDSMQKVWTMIGAIASTLAKTMSIRRSQIATG